MRTRLGLFLVSDDERLRRPVGERAVIADRLVDAFACHASPLLLEGHVHLDRLGLDPFAQPRPSGLDGSRADLQLLLVARDLLLALAATHGAAARRALGEAGRRTFLGVPEPVVARELALRLLRDLLAVDVGAVLHLLLRISDRDSVAVFARA